MASPAASPNHVQAENERSFKLLQEYLQQARSGDLRSPAARAAYHFAFYVREGDAHAVGETADGTAAAARETTTSRSSSFAGAGAGNGSGGERLKRVAVSLPPPQRHSEASLRLSGTSRKAIRKLLAAVGLEHAWPRRGEASSGGSAGETAGDPCGYDSDDEAGALSLSAFLPDAAEQLRQVRAERETMGTGRRPGINCAWTHTCTQVEFETYYATTDRWPAAAMQPWSGGRGKTGPREERVEGSP
eukprot:359660-Chlamydomonas_euryale.AAC.13